MDRRARSAVPFRRLAAFTLASWLLAALLPGAPLAAGGYKVIFGVLPVMQALPVFIAAEKGYFAQEGLEVELVPFNSAMEKDVALSSGSIDGCFADLVTPLVQAGNGVQASVAATLYNTSGDQRMFAVLRPPKSAARPLAVLAREGIAGSSNTIIDFVVDRLLEKAAGKGLKVTVVETKSIPIRLQMLMTGQVAAAALPEPLATLAESQGAAVVADDRGLGISPTVLVFNNAFLDARTESARRFLRAVASAIHFINTRPEQARPVMIDQGRVPEGLRDKVAIPIFPALSVPDPALVADIAGWLKARGVVTGDLPYAQVVRVGLIP